MESFTTYVFCHAKEAKIRQGCVGTYRVPRRPRTALRDGCRVVGTTICYPRNGRVVFILLPPHCEHARALLSSQRFTRTPPAHRVLPTHVIPEGGHTDRTRIPSMYHKQRPHSLGPHLPSRSSILSSISVHLRVATSNIEDPPLAFLPPSSPFSSSSPPSSSSENPSPVKAVAAAAATSASFCLADSVSSCRCRDATLDAPPSPPGGPGAAAAAAIAPEMAAAFFAAAASALSPAASPVEGFREGEMLPEEATDDPPREARPAPPAVDATDMLPRLLLLEPLPTPRAFLWLSLAAIAASMTVSKALRRAMAALAGLSPLGVKQVSGRTERRYYSRPMQVRCRSERAHREAGAGRHYTTYRDNRWCCTTGDASVLFTSTRRTTAAICGKNHSRKTHGDAWYGKVNAHLAAARETRRSSTACPGGICDAARPPALT